MNTYDAIISWELKELNKHYEEVEQRKKHIENKEKTMTKIEMETKQNLVYAPVFVKVK